MTPRPPTEAELHAFIDGELDRQRQDEVARALEADPALAARVATYAADGDNLRRALSGIEAAPLNPAWIEMVERGATSAEAPPAPRPLWRTRPMGPTRATGPVLPTRATRPVWPTRATRPTRRTALLGGFGAAACAVAAAVAIRHPRGDTLLASAETARGSDGETFHAPPPGPERDALLQRETGLHVRAPDLRPFGFDLVGLRVFGKAGAGAAQLSYLDERRRRLTVFVRSSDGHVRFDITHVGTLRACVWQDDVVGAVIIAPMGAGEMLRIASSAYGALDL